MRWRRRLRDIADDTNFEIAWTETWAWITDPLRAPAIDALLDGNENPGLRELLAQFQRRWLAIQERREAEHLISSVWDPGALASKRIRAGFGRLTYDSVRGLLDLVEIRNLRLFDRM